ncbi:MerR family transcriptional regulator [Hansschlegelia quercus]|uniref:MerR family transcriptional regulator n=1 Tax=Hansschlegelia quercus TaxID=2528245 RepID=A0A4Q9GJS7_9HYPH|nr:MerR family transcriptional regulator [Hansschlegelia quercus]TBN54402.1 MerR family transcriptional regulator [Hansschlegelia quercus]
MSDEDGDLEREGKGPDAFRTISEVAEDLGLPQHVLRFWETRFPQIKPIKRGGGRRYYRPNDVELLRGVKQLLYGEGYTIRGVQRILREQGGRKAAAAAGLTAAAERALAAEPSIERPQEPRMRGLMDDSVGPDFWAPAGRGMPQEPETPRRAETPPEDLRDDRVIATPAPVVHAGLSDAQRAGLIGALDDLLECRRLLAGRN